MEEEEADEMEVAAQENEKRKEEKETTKIIKILETFI